MSKYPMYEGKETCERCHKSVEKDKAVWFEMSYSGDWYPPGTLCDEDNQGGFAFGPDCAKEVRKHIGSSGWKYVGLAIRNGA